ncbi:MAG: hypothetical protein K2X36_06580 [Microbacteriaceae bacterium]|nr:hypothetical protein [Microbacteriaceae bacterium]
MTEEQEVVPSREVDEAFDPALSSTVNDGAALAGGGGTGRHEGSGVRQPFASPEAVMSTPTASSTDNRWSLNSVAVVTATKLSVLRDVLARCGT